MKNPIAASVWPRPAWSDSGQDAFLLWFVFGRFDTELDVPGDVYRTRGVPAGLDLRRYANAELRRWDGYPLAGRLGRSLRTEDSDLAERAAAAPDCVMLRGSLADPPDLDYLRDCIGLITGLLDQGGSAVIDPQTLALFGANAWRQRYFAADTLAPRDHVLILADAEANPERVAVHTRGLRKFARPDLHIRAIPESMAGAAGQLAEDMTAFQIRGGVIPEGHAVEIPGGGVPMHARHAGDGDDPDFSNRYIEFIWPA